MPPRGVSREVRVQVGASASARTLNQVGIVKERKRYEESIVSSIGAISHVGKLRRQYKDQRTRRLRQTRLQENWEYVVNGMADAYISWKDPPPSNEGGNPSSETTTSEYDFTVDIVDIYTLQTETNISRSPDCESARALVAHGLIPCSPIFPSLAISISTLENLRCIRLDEPSFSVGAFAKVTCDLYNRPYSSNYRQQFANAFAIYLRIHPSARCSLPMEVDKL